MRNFFFTVDVEEWFASKLIKTTQEDREKLSDFVEPMKFILNLLEVFDIKATFFFVYQTVKKYPEVFYDVVKRGHEVALHGENHDNIFDLGPTKFRDMVKSMKSTFKESLKINLLGYRAPHFGMSDIGLRILEGEGFIYDSSVVPCIHIPGWYGNASAPLLSYKVSPNFGEFPISVHPKFRLPGAGGYYFRNLGVRWSEKVVVSSLKILNYAVFYIHPWELSNNNPANSGASFYTFRRTGDWSRKNLKRLLFNVTKLRDIQCSTISNSINNL